MITLKQALNLPKNQLADLRQEIQEKTNQNAKLGAYVEQLNNEKIQDLHPNTVPILIKDNICVKNAPLTCCSKILQGYKSPYNATVIDKMLSSGLGAFGRANMDEFAMGSTTATSCYGKTLNPHNDLCVPGGSSGGSAAAVASGIAIAALGSDTGGSVRQPAAFCGCVGVKPTYSRVSRYGLAAFSSSFDQIGTLTQNVEDSAILYDIISGYDSKDSTSSAKKITPVTPNLNPNKKFTFALIENFVQESSPSVRASLLDLANNLEKAGHKIVRKKMSKASHHISAYYILTTAEASANLARFDGVRYGNRQEGKNLKDLYFETRTKGFGDEVKRRILLGSFVLSSGYYDAYYKKAQKVRHLIKNEYDELFGGVDAILSPVAPSVAFEFGSKKSALDVYLNDIFTISINLAGLPALSLPIGKDGQNLPLAVQIIARAFDEQTMYDAAFSIEKFLQ